MGKLEIQTPCHEDWNKMQGSDKKRYCASCEHHVEDFTDKSVDEIIEILRSRDGRTCGRLRRNQMNPIKKIAATVIVGAMLSGCQPEGKVLGEISAPSPIGIDTTEQGKVENHSTNTSEHDILLGDTILIEKVKTGIMTVPKGSSEEHGEMKTF